MWIVKHRKIFYTFSALCVAVSIAAFALWGLNFGIDFTGGSLMEIAYTGTTPAAPDVLAAIEGVGIHGASVRPTGETGYIIRTPFLSNDQHIAVDSALTGNGQWKFEEKSFDAIGPTIGTELQTKSVWAIGAVILAIALFIMFAFRKVSEPVASWKYGVITLIALAHDVIIPLGAFVFLGHFMGAEVDTLFVTAILVVLGFSVHDSIVVFDRVRENLHVNKEKNFREPFEEVVGRSVQQTLSRSINTSLTVVLVLLALFIWGPASVHFFVLALIIGVIAGTYSSVFLGSPMLVSAEKMQKSKDDAPRKRK